MLATVGGVTRPRVDPRLALLAAGLGLHLVTDLTYLLLNPAGHDRDGGPVALGWLSALAVLATAACHRDTTRHPDRDTPAELDGSTTAVAPTLSGLAALAVLMAGCRTTLPPAAAELAAACLLIALLRTALTLRQLRALPAARREARTDPLTDLANRRHLQEHCTGLLARPDAAPVSLLMVDLNDFKIVNDRHGHLAGDLVLAQVAARLGAVIRDRDLLGRLGGDEFVALLPSTTPRQAQLVAQRMQAKLAPPITVAGHQIHVGASIGISTAARPGSTATSLFHAADAAMYRAKNTAPARRPPRPPTTATISPAATPSPGVAHGPDPDGRPSPHPAESTRAVPASVAPPPTAIPATSWSAKPALAAARRRIHRRRASASGPAPTQA